MRRSAAAFHPAFLLLPFLHVAVLQTGAKVQLQTGLLRAGREGLSTTQDH